MSIKFVVWGMKNPCVKDMCVRLLSSEGDLVRQNRHCEASYNRVSSMSEDNEDRVDDDSGDGERIGVSESMSVVELVIVAVSVFASSIDEVGVPII